MVFCEMETLEQLRNVDFFGWLIIGLLILSAVTAIYKIVNEFLSIIGKPVGVMKQRKADHELLVKTVNDLRELHNKHEEDTKQSIQHDEIIRNELRTLAETILKIKEEVTLMRTQRDEDKLAEYKDKIGESYRFYCARKYSDEEPVPYWNHMEKEALKGLITQYESHGGSNSFVHSKVEIEMQTWKVID